MADFHNVLAKLCVYTYFRLGQTLWSNGQGERLPSLPSEFSDNVPFFFEEPFKCTFFGNIKSEILNIQ